MKIVEAQEALEDSIEGKDYRVKYDSVLIAFNISIPPTIGEEDQIWQLQRI